MTAATARAAEPAINPVGEVPRDYNFAADILDRNLKAGRADKTVYIDPRGEWTYGQLADRVARFSAALRGLGLRREERVLVCLTDTIDWPTAFLGCLKAGIIAVPVNTLLTESDYAYMLGDSRAKCLVVSDVLYPRFEKLIPNARGLEHVIVSGDNAHGHKKFEDLIANTKPDGFTAPTTRDDMAFWLYTSARPARRRARCIFTAACG
jgi:benzoate-CoA ligase